MRLLSLTLLASQAAGFAPPMLPHRSPASSVVVVQSVEESAEEPMIEADEPMVAVNGDASVDEAPSDVEEAPPAASLPDPVVETDVEETLASLLQISASTGRGEFATAEQKDKAASLIAQLEAQNPTDEPANSPLAQGRWELLYSSTQLFRSSPFFMAGRAVCSTPEQAKQYDWFCDMHRKALAISSIGQVRQIITDTKMISEFEVQVGSVPFLSDFTPFAYSGGWPVTVEGAIVSSADITPSSNGNAWELYMDTGRCFYATIRGLAVANEWVPHLFRRFFFHISRD